MKKFFAIIVLGVLITLHLAAVLLLTGCAAMVPTERHQSQSVKTTENIAVETERTTQRQFSVVPEAAIAIARDGTNSQVVSIPLGNSVTETFTTTSRTGTGAGSKDSANGSFTSTIPLFVKLIGAAIGGFLILGVIYFARKSSAGVDAAYKVADQGFANLVGTLRTMATQSTNPEQLNVLNSLIAEVNDQRGKATRKK